MSTWDKILLGVFGMVMLSAAIMAGLAVAEQTARVAKLEAQVKTLQESATTTKGAGK